MPSVETLTTFCKKKGFIFPSADLYGGMAGFFDYGPLGVDLKRNIEAHWWKTFVQDRDDIVGMDGAQITNPKVWEASGHVENFDDILVEDTVTQERYRADHLIEDELKINVEGLSPQDLWNLIKDNNIKSPKGNELAQPKQFNLMFSTQVGPVTDDSSVAYLRPETAQMIFTNFRLIQETSRMKLPFGIAQSGKAFRNEISPRDFLFRSREFEQMEIEFFIHPDNDTCPLLTKKHTTLSFMLYDKKQQKKGTQHSKTTVKKMLDKKMLGEWHAYWLAESYFWYKDIGLKEKNLRVREHTEDELSHYASATFDIDYKFPFGWKEIFGNANRGQFDLDQHIKHSGKNMEIFDEATKKKVLPRVIEPSFGLDRVCMALLLDAYQDDKERGNIVLSLDKEIAPVKIAVFPLHNKLEEQALEVYLLIKSSFPSMYDRSGSIGRRYARADEIGIPFCVTFDFDSLEDKSVTIRDRDSTKQVRIPIEELHNTFSSLFADKDFDAFVKKKQK